MNRKAYVKLDLEGRNRHSELSCVGCGTTECLDDTKKPLDNQRRPRTMRQQDCILSIEFSILVPVGRVTPFLQYSTYSNVLSFRAYAKINLGLFVIDKRPDGYHNIETVFHRIDLFDEISFNTSPQITVVSSSSTVPGNEQNLCYKAASLLARHLGVTEGVTISLQKNIPVGAGLGGGSSDAATVLLHLPRFWGRKVSMTDLHPLALQLGSDVPFFIGTGSALAKGRGEILEYFALDVPFSILLCDPGIHISTAWAYRQVTPSRRETDLKELAIRGMKDTSLLSALENDFEEPVFREHPVIRKVKESMLEASAIFSSMSGSGSTVYGLYSDPQKAIEATGILGSRGWKTFLTHPHFSPSEP